jgi:hypothetical protein
MRFSVRFNAYSDERAVEVVGFGVAETFRAGGALSIPPCTGKSNRLVPSLLVMFLTSTLRRGRWQVIGAGQQGSHGASPI